VPEVLHEGWRGAAGAVGVRGVHAGEVLLQGVPAGGLEEAPGDLQEAAAAASAAWPAAVKNGGEAHAAAAAAAVTCPELHFVYFIWRFMRSPSTSCATITCFEGCT
jgi:hypothetical protein